MTVTDKVIFRPLSKADIPQMHIWFNKPHVQQYYSLREWSLDEVESKLLPYIENATNVFGFIILKADLPIGYVQCYRVADYPWPDQDISDDIIRQTAGIDLFIGDEKYIGSGLGTVVITEVLEQLIWPHFDYCIVDPDMRNMAMIKCCENSKFKHHKLINTEDKLGQAVKLQLMIVQNPKSGN